MISLSLGPNDPKLVFRAQIARSRYFSDLMILLDSTILNKMRSFFMKIGARPGFWTSRLVSLLGPNFPKLVYRLQTPNVTVLESKNYSC